MCRRIEWSIRLAVPARRIGRSQTFSTSRSINAHPLRRVPDRTSPPRKIQGLRSSLRQRAGSAEFHGQPAYRSTGNPGHNAGEVSPAGS